MKPAPPVTKNTLIEARIARGARRGHALRTRWLSGARALGASALVAACVAPAPRPPTPSSPRRVTPVPAPAKPFRALSAAAKRRTMVEVVLPAMARELRAFDADLFPAPSCATCHGPDAEERGWAMPNPRLARLSSDGRFDVEMRHSPEFTMFMVKRMQPRMRELLQDETLDCFRCHLPRER